MQLDKFFKTAALTGAACFMMAASASATTISYTTNAAGTEFTSSSSLTLLSAPGSTAGASLVFTPNTSSASGTPSNIDLGSFQLDCTLCSTQAAGIASSSFNPFTFDLVVSDTTDGATGEFVGTSTGGAVWSNVSGITISWAPLQLGPGTSNALTGSFGTTDFTTSLFTGIAAPNSGTPPGNTTVQGFVGSANTPEPASFGLIGGGLLGLGLLRRKTFFLQ